jgi:hypothetical protein
MEVNPRMGGSVALAIAAGVDFPQLLFDWKVGAPLHEVRSYRIGRRLRWLPGDIRHLTSVYDEQGRPDVPGRARATARFVADFARRRTAIDVFERADWRPALCEMDRIVWFHAKQHLPRPRPAERLTALSPLD